MNKNKTGPAPLRAVISSRVSVDDVGKGKRTRDEQTEQMSISIQAQIDTGRALIAREEYQLVFDPHELVDDGVSGYKGADRKGFDKLMRLVVGGHIDVIVTRAVDRIGRNDADNSAIRIAAAQHGVRFHLFNGSVIDPRQSNDKLTLQITQGIAEYQSALKSETVRNVYGAMRDRGELRSGHKVFGWQWKKNEPKLSMKEEPDERELIQEAYARLLGEGRRYTVRGKSHTSQDSEKLYAICGDWNARGIRSVTGKQWGTQSLRAVLLRPSNALYIRLGDGWDYDRTVDSTTGEIRRGKWDRLIDDETYSQARALLLSPSRRTNPGRRTTHLVSGIARCGLCASPLRSSSVDDKKGGRMPIYRCVTKMNMPDDPGVKHVSARIEPLDAAVRRAVIAAFVFGPKNLFSDEAPTQAAEIHDDIDGVLRKRQELLSLVAEDVVSLGDARGQLASLKNREAVLRADLDTAMASDADAMRLSDLRAGLWKAGRVSIDATAEYKRELGARFDSLDIERRRALVRHLLDVEVRPRSKGVYGARRWKILHKVVTSLNA
ncbi:recombinase family protein [Microbacterium chocolatum]|uniref:recombinase family protein n=1 Tax=Microbacterium aurantiacum TaxID=162393 RepID=UPI00338D3F46